MNVKGEIANPAQLRVITMNPRLSKGTQPPVYIEKRKSGHSHKKCYLGFTKGCSDKISGEHYISRSLLNLIEKHNKTIDVSGLSWLPKGHIKSIGKSSLEANILCTYHNSKLSPFDTEIEKFVSAIFSIDKDFIGDSSVEHKYFVDGTYIERWIMKTIVGMIKSNQIIKGPGSSFGYRNKVLDLICSSTVRYPSGWGLYFSRTGTIHHSSSFELIPKYIINNEVLALGLKFNGFEMHFLMGARLLNLKEYWIYRPRKMIFKKGSVSSEVNFNWKNHKVGDDVVYSYIDKYSGPSPDHNLPRWK